MLTLVGPYNVAADAEERWTAHVHDTASRRRPMQVDSWMTSINKNVARRQKCAFGTYTGFVMA